MGIRQRPAETVLVIVATATTPGGLSETPSHERRWGARRRSSDVNDGPDAWAGPWREQVVGPDGASGKPETPRQVVIHAIEKQHANKKAETARSASHGAARFARSSGAAECLAGTVDGAGDEGRRELGAGLSLRG